MISKKTKARAAAVLAAAVSATAVVPSLATAFGASAAQSAATDDTYAGRFAALYDDVVTNGQANGYLSKNTNKGSFGESFGIPYHAVETVICEAPDYGHETTSEAMSYIVWMAAMRDVLGAQDTNDLSASNDLKKAWSTLEAVVPGWSTASNASVNYKSIWNQSNGLKADSAPELDTPEEYPTHNQGGDAKNPLYKSFQSAYSSDQGYYLMHWLADVDDWYGFGGGNGNFTFINTFQRGRQESCFETVPHPCLEELKYGNSSDGIKGIFNGVGNVAPQYAFTNAPDAEDRAIQAVNFANIWGAGDKEVSALAGKMGDQCRNDMFDKYYKAIGCQDIMTSGVSEADALKGQHFLMAWYTSWGGDLTSQYSWAWQIGCSHSHEFYQNPLAAYALIYDNDLNAGMKSSGATDDYKTSLKRQIEMYLWLQSAEGPIGGGCTNSLNGRYEKYPAGMSTFYDMAYVAHPVYADPGSNHWIGNQVWAIQRLAELYYYVKINGDATNGAKDFGGLTLEEALETILSRWIDWFINNIKWDTVDDDGNEVRYMIPSNLSWGEVDEDGDGQADDWSYNPDNQPATWTGKYSATANNNYHCEITSYGYSDVGCVSSLCNTLIYYAAANKVDAAAAQNGGNSLAEESLLTANKLLTYQWDNARDDIGLSYVEHNGSLSRLFTQSVYIPNNYTGKMPDGSVLANGATFESIRTQYNNEAKFQELKAAYESTGSTEDVDLTYHRFWHVGDAIMSYGGMALLFPEVEPYVDGQQPTTGDDEDLLWGDADDNKEVNINDVVVIMSYANDESNDFVNAKAKKQADVFNNGDGVNASDAVSVQKYLAKLLPELPESYMQ